MLVNLKFFREENWSRECAVKEEILESSSDIISIQSCFNSPKSEWEEDTECKCREHSNIVDWNLAQVPARGGLISQLKNNSQSSPTFIECSNLCNVFVSSCNDFLTLLIFRSFSSFMMLSCWCVSGQLNI